MDISGVFGECSQILVLGANTVCLETYSRGALRTSLWCHWLSYWLISLEENRKTCGQMGEPTGELKSQAGFPLLLLFLLPRSFPPFSLFLPTPPTFPSPLSFHFSLPFLLFPHPLLQTLRGLGRPSWIGWGWLRCLLWHLSRALWLTVPSTCVSCGERHFLWEDGL